MFKNFIMKNVLNILISITIIQLGKCSSERFKADYTFWELSGETKTKEQDSTQLKLWLTISAKKRYLEISWKNAPAHEDDRIMLTSEEPVTFKKLKWIPTDKPPLAEFKTPEPQPEIDLPEGSGQDYALNSVTTTTTESPYKAKDIHYWIVNNGSNPIIAALVPTAPSLWFTTGVPFDYALSRNVTYDTTAYGYWASYVRGSDGIILATTSLRAYPKWMNDMRSIVGGYRFRDLFIPGSHDSGSYRVNFDPLIKETLVTKYSLTQDDDILGQLMHGIRYLDIRVGYYRNTAEKFFVNHGITKQRPLIEVIDQVKEFVQKTNEIVIFGLKEFPVGFGKNLTVHHKLVNYLKNNFGDLIVHPSLTWRASLNDIWLRKQNVILGYDLQSVVNLYPHLLFSSVEQRWGNVQSWKNLESFLRSINGQDISRLFSRPVADMAELTPKTWDVIVNKYGGLRKMADGTNWRISQLYMNELGDNANIVAVDFYRGTTIVETALDFNRRKTIYK